ncbi:unnamed protein product [Sympodiomycopsis kandeliae]
MAPMSSATASPCSKHLSAYLLGSGTSEMFNRRVSTKDGRLYDDGAPEESYKNEDIQFRNGDTVTRRRRNGDRLKAQKRI